jgi:hypothetical protein
MLPVVRPLAVAALLLAGCAGDVGEAGGDDDGPDVDAGELGPDAGEALSFPPAPSPLPTSFDPDDLLTDDMIFGGEAITVDQVLDFLALEGSFLATYEADGLTAAEAIVDLSRDRGVNPLYMLARIQTESSLVSSGDDDHLDAATGCGCPDGGGCDPALSGFFAQVDCAALKMQEYFEELDTDGVTRAGWIVGQVKNTLDPCEVTPANRATAALYTYTPWVGAYSTGCGETMWGGSSLVALSYYRFWGAYPWGTDP